tara:strand:- start:928 stop:1593 length:666 start_codon:yes stop_codon:yes gene_type:complete
MKKYCIIGLDKISELKEGLVSISDNLNFIDSNKVLVGTFTCAMPPSQIRTVLRIDNGGSFFLFELNPKTCSIYVNKDEVQDSLFKEFDELSDGLENDNNKTNNRVTSIEINSMDEFQQMVSNMMSNFMIGDNPKDYKGLDFSDNRLKDMLGKIPFVTGGNKYDTEVTRIKDNNEVKDGEFDKNSLSDLKKAEKEEIINDILSRVPNLTDNEKKTLEFLSKD